MTIYEKYKTEFETFKRGGYSISALKGLSNKQIADLLTVLNRHDPNIADITSSEHAEVFTCRTESLEKNIYVKKYFYRSFVDICKHCFRPSRAKRAMKASIMLQRNGHDAPQILALIEKNIGLFKTEVFLITDKVENNGSVATYWQNNIAADRCSLRKKFIESFAQEIGMLHSSGIFHGDLRLNNVLVTATNNEWNFFFIDNERTRKFDSIPKRMRLKNLVQINMFRDRISNTDRMRFFKAYSVAAGLTKNMYRPLVKAITKKTLWRLNRKTANCIGFTNPLQNQRSFQRGCVGNFSGVFFADFCTAYQSADFFGQIDRLIETGMVLKNDVATHVVRCTYNGLDIVIKRYNYQGLWHSLRHTIKGSRAKKCWLFGHRLTDAGIPCAAPLAFVEQRKYGLIRQSYIINEFIPGISLQKMITANTYSKDEKKHIISLCEEFLNKLTKFRLTHGDMKPSNILLHDEKPLLIDLDSMKQHRCSIALTYYTKKMFRHFDGRLNF
jgi:tRNA A-37 threonylcarbamoyl transferase component Bud32